MPFEQLKLTSINELDDARVAKAFELELARAVRDCLDRPRDKHPRIVTIELSLVPVLGDGEGGTVIEAEGVEGEFSVKSKVPQRKSKTYSFRANKQGQLSFSTESPENAAQTTFSDIDPKTGKVNREKPAE